MSALTADSIIHVTEHQLTCEIDGESVILHVRDGVYYGLDAVGTFVWNAIREPASVASIRDAIVERFEVGAEQCEADLIALLNDLREHELVSVA